MFLEHQHILVSQSESILINTIKMNKCVINLQHGAELEAFFLTKRSRLPPQKAFVPDEDEDACRDCMLPYRVL